MSRREDLFGVNDPVAPDTEKSSMQFLVQATFQPRNETTRAEIKGVSRRFKAFSVQKSPLEIHYS